MPIVNTNKQYHNKIHNNTTDHLNILQCNIQGVSSTFERIDKLITIQIASAYDSDILLISETLADNLTLLKLHRSNWHFELHDGYTKTGGCLLGIRTEGFPIIVKTVLELKEGVDV